MIAIDLDDLELSDEASELLNKLDDLTPLLKRLGNEAHAIIAVKFRREGPGWKPLSEATLSRRRKEGEGAKILRDSGKLFGSITDSASEGSVYELNTRELTLGTNLEYAAVHQFGSRDGHIPKRPYVPDEGELSQPFERVILRYFERNAI